MLYPGFCLNHSISPLLAASRSMATISGWGGVCVRVGVEEADGVGGAVGLSEGEGDGEEVEELTEEWLTSSTRPCSGKDKKPEEVFNESGKRFSGYPTPPPTDL